MKKIAFMFSLALLFLYMNAINVLASSSTTFYPDQTIVFVNNTNHGQASFTTVFEGAERYFIDFPFNRHVGFIDRVIVSGTTHFSTSKYGISVDRSDEPIYITINEEEIKYNIVIVDSNNQSLKKIVASYNEEITLDSSDILLDGLEVIGFVNLEKEVSYDVNSVVKSLTETNMKNVYLKAITRCLGEHVFDYFNSDEDLIAKCKNCDELSITPMPEITINAFSDIAICTDELITIEASKSFFNVEVFINNILQEVSIEDKGNVYIINLNSSLLPKEKNVNIVVKGKTNYGVVKIAQKTINHAFDHICDEASCVSDCHCKACGRVISSGYFHDIESLERIEYRMPSTLNEGNNEYYHCPLCGMNFTKQGNYISNDDIIIPRLLPALDSTYYQQEGSDLEILLSIETSKLLCIMIDDLIVKNTDYQFPGSDNLKYTKKIIISKDLLESLKQGNHKLKFIFTYGEVTCDLAIQYSNYKGSSTGCNNNALIRYVVQILMLSLFTLSIYRYFKD